MSNLRRGGYYPPVGLVGLMIVGVVRSAIVACGEICDCGVWRGLRLRADNIRPYETAWQDKNAKRQKI
ncbi:MAG: hypothetical protein FWG65_03395 [Turicibacter sp.]|nr:hypothetical protein [Turicibacter sp.]